MLSIVGEFIQCKDIANVIVEYATINLRMPSRFYPFMVLQSKHEQIVHSFETTQIFILFNLSDCHLANIQLNYVTTLILLNCEKNAVYYNCRPFMFPNVKTIILINSNPCNCAVVKRFSEETHWISNFGSEYYSYCKYHKEIKTIEQIYYQYTSYNHFDRKDEKICYQGQWIEALEYERLQQKFWGWKLFEKLHESK